MGHIRIICKYWARVLIEAASRGVKLATGGWKRFIISTLVLVLVWAGLFFGMLEGPSAGTVARNIFNGLMALAFVFIALVVVGVIVVPPQFDKQIREEKEAEEAKAEEPKAKAKAEEAKPEEPKAEAKAEEAKADDTAKKSDS